ncbi:MAG: M1 family aminopeptidase [Acidobacteriota bacterium]
MKWLWWLAAVLPLAAAEPAHELAEQLRHPQLDPAACYRARDLSFSREDIRFYFTEGWLIFGKPVDGRIHTAVFERDAESGDAEVLLMPPTKGERLSLAKFTGSPNLNEHFHHAVMVFSDDSADRLLKALTSAGEPKQSAEMGHLLAQKWQETVTNLSASFLTKLVEQVYGGTPPERGFFYAGVNGRALGNFDLFHDPGARDQVYAGRLAYRENVPFYDIWTTFHSKPYRTGPKQFEPFPFAMDNIRIEAVLDESLHLRAATRATIVPARRTKMLAFEISSQMKVGEVRVNGEAAEVLARESLRANLLRGSGAVTFLVAPSQPMEAGVAYEIEFEHEGDVIQKAGEDVYFVGARTNWYPRSGFVFARHDITFTYPAQLQLLFPGELKEDKSEGGLHTTRRVPAEPIRLAGFNLGLYESARVNKGPLSVEVFANRHAERALQRPPEVILQPPQAQFPRSRGPQRPEMLTLPPMVPNPLARLQTLAGEIALTFDEFTQDFGPPAMPHLLVSPIPGRFGQGFPGLLYISTLTYLDAKDRPVSTSDRQTNLFFSELLQAHETAHQWWGNVVTSVAQQDDWLMEALANYSSLLVLEKKKGPKDVQRVMAEYKSMLLAKDNEGKTVESTGPIRLGLRLQSSQNPGAWRNIVYDKGAWILHMLRARMGDANFRAMLGEFAKRNRFQAVTAEQFRQLAASYLPKGAPDAKLESFFESWVEGTGIPTLTLTQKLTGKAPALKLNLTLNQRGVDENFSTMVPVVVEVARLKPQVIWIQSGSEPATATIPLKAPPTRVTLDPENTILAERK